MLELYTSYNEKFVTIVQICYRIVQVCINIRHKSWIANTISVGHDVALTNGPEEKQKTNIIVSLQSLNKFILTFAFVLYTVVLIHTPKYFDVLF